MKERIGIAIRTMAVFGVFAIALLLLTNTVNAEIPVSDGFDYPVGIPDGTSGENGYGYSVAAGFTDTSYKGIPHLGEDWNSAECATCDLGDPVYAIANGFVRYAQDTKIDAWKGVIIIDHVSIPGTKFKLPSGDDVTQASSMYAHLDITKINEWVQEGFYVRRGQQIGVIGPTPLGSTGPHLHFEIRSDISIGLGSGYSTDTTGWLDPRGLINDNRPQTAPLIGDWDGDNKDTTGTYDPRELKFALDNGVNVVKDDTKNFPEPGDLSIIGDWNGDGKDTVGVYRPKTAEFFLDNNNDGISDETIPFGNIGDYPITGDWNGDGKDDVGIVRQVDPTKPETTFFLKYPDKTESIAFGTKTDMPIAGDWNNDGKDEIGFFRKNDPDYENNAVFYLKNNDKTITIKYGNNDDIPINGKWDSDGLTKIGVYRPSTKEFIFDHSPLGNHGLHAHYYNEPIYRNNIDAIAKPDAERIDPNVDFSWHTGASKLPPGILNDGWWSADFAGYIYIDKEGMYNFNLNSDDGSWLFIDGEKVIDNGGDHAPRWVWGQKTLTKGYHSIWVKYFESLGGEANLNLYWLPPDVMVYAPIPQDKLYVTSPEEILPKLQLSKKAPANMAPGNAMTYTLYFTNYGGKAVNVDLEDKLPPEEEVAFISVSDGGIYDEVARTVKWTVPSIDTFPQGIGSRTVTVKVKDDASLGTVIKNIVVTGSGTEILTANAQTTVTKSDLPPNVYIEPIAGNTGGTISVFWKGPITFSYYSACAAGVGIDILYSDGSHLTEMMTKSPNNMWTYTVPGPGFEPHHGEAKVKYTIAGCDGTKILPFSIYIDPAGFIYDIATGKRISNATVWLQQPDNQGNWHNVEIGQTLAIMQPDTNPLITNQDGQYQWDVLNGTYRIHVEALGYYPEDSIAVNIPPPVTDLNVGLTHLPDDIPPTTMISLSGTQGNNNWYISNVEVNLTATDNEGGSGVKATKYSFDNIAWNIYTVPFNITSEGTTMIYYRSIDNADNSETVKTQTIRIDKTPPSISITGVINNSYYNSNVTVYVNSMDANLYNQSMTLNGYPYINGTNITEEGSYTLIATATDLAGNNASKTISFVIDKTPPEASISFNATTKNITVYNNDTKIEANYIILPAKNNKDDSSDVEERNEDNEGNESGWSLRQYALQDQANNFFTLILNYKSEGKETKAEIISLQYNNGTVITVENSTIKTEHSVDKNGSIKELEQKIKTQKDSEIEAKYSLKNNETEIKVDNEKQEEKETRPGLVILEILTDNGSLKYNY